MKTFSETAHRPWPLPSGRPAMVMRWHGLLFAHWPVAPEELAPHLPSGLTLDTFDGRAYLGVVPFRMSGVRPRGLPPIPGLSSFPEVNLRTYVTAGGKAGVWFFSLDAANPLAVRLARRFFHLPYFDARMRVSADGEAVIYDSRRTHRGALAARLRARYRPTGEPYRAAPGSLDGFLTERYCLYAADRRGDLWRGDIHHSPWPLQPAAAEIEINSLAEPIGIELDGPPRLAFARYLEVVAWRLQPVSIPDADEGSR